ncbi:hypothetical protein B0H10DRAFT_1980448 [Mycena sp. CBHHK59/15]|nr:hypothetical protein B0H10DRAFT_1980448 [Mycena sp. CBHHK59/15]
MDSCPFPLEVIDLIIGHLHLDLSALKSCALVCRDWIPSCRTHLFRRLQLRPEGKDSPDNWFQHLSAAPHIVSYIHELAILCERSSWVSWDPLLPALLTKLLHLAQIELHGCDLPWLPAPLTSAIYTLFRLPSMKRVQLRLCVLPASCFDLFGPALEQIALSDVALERDVTVHVEEQSRTARPKHLLVEGKHIASMVDCLVPSPESTQLEDLQRLCIKYQGDDADTLDAIEMLLQAAGNLEHLTMGLYPASIQSTPTFSTAPSICYNRQLRTLWLSHFDMNRASPTNQLPWLRSLLSRLTPEHMLQAIAIDARQRPSREAPVLDADGWARVDDVLAGSGLPHLRDVHIRVGEAFAAGVCQISASMPALCARRVLRVTM